MKSKTSYEQLLDTIKSLRDPVNGCPWDIKQTISTLAPSLLEECCECIDGASAGDNDNVAEELGDIIFTATSMCRILEEENITTIDEIINEVNNKMIRRHPHVFSNKSGIETSSQVLKQWDEIKENIEGRKLSGLLSKIPKSLPALDRSNEIQKKVEKVGFDWISVDDVISKIHEEIEEVKVELDSNNTSKLELEIGDLLFSVVNLARYLKIDPSRALSRTNHKFSDRFQYIENRMKEKNLELNAENFDIMDQLWEEAKQELS